MMAVRKTNKALKTFSLRNIIIAVIFGFGIAVFFIYRDVKMHGANNFSLTSCYLWWLFLAILMICLRHIAYMYRIWLLTDKKISFRNTFSTITLWEFASSVTPTVVGGTAVAFFIINKEGIKMGRTTAIVLITLMLDELFFVLLIPVFLLTMGSSVFFAAANLDIGSMNLGIKELFLIGYFISFIVVIIMFAGVFISPQTVKNFLCRITRIPFMKRWQHKAEATGNDIVTASLEFKNRSIAFWLKAFGATVLAWITRYLTVNFLIMMFVISNDQLLIFARQLFMWVILLITPTPGASGAAEYGFTVFLGEFLPLGIAAPLAFFWRLISYYPYIIMGVIVLPVWLRRVVRKTKQKALH